MENQKNSDVIAYVVQQENDKNNLVNNSHGPAN